MTSSSRSGAFRAFVGAHRDAVEAALDELLPASELAPQRLHEAMRYAMFPGGKRLRPMLTLIGAAATGGQTEDALRPAAALECLHTYSLVHDDLPCMDDDDLRRGRATCHKVYGEPLALLAGDALLTLAFAGCAAGGGEAVAALASAAGSVGMVGGQVEDLAAEGSLKGGGSGSLEESPEASMAKLEWIHDHKTGALITAALVVGAHAAAGPGGVPADVLEILSKYGDTVGRAFQIADDCLDVTGSPEELGKNPGADVALGKLTWPALLGLEQSQAAARSLAEQASALAVELAAAVAAWRTVAPTCLDEMVLLLQDVAFYAVERRT